MKSKSQGFTLAEMMIVVLVLAILATIAYPSYARYIRQTRLNNVRADLIHNAKALERYYAQKNTFVGFSASTLTQNDYFDISFSSEGTASGFTLQAIPNSSNSDETCTVYINDSGILWAVSSGSDDCPGYDRLSS
ncbi:type IV pilin protein [Neisseria perflava]|uniref:type IV pilin protein n=1 Tax=Neisseria perflava TaxID=33053 RepID=UPI00209E1E47|nr:type IV pilin protein [Neisseria perflava]MCP1659394.1 type IV pilus assembly protein PilE [Neisseria perflava]